MFRMATELTPHQYILDQRISRAQSMLQQSATSLIEMAAECGFSSQSHMTNVFRTRGGLLRSITSAFCNLTLPGNEVIRRPSPFRCFQPSAEDNYVLAKVLLKAY
jgi:hypothetical protein